MSEGNQQLFHGSYKPIDSIQVAGIFSGVFASANPRAALSHGDVLHVVESPRPLDDFTLNYEIEGARDVAMAICGQQEDVADIIMTPGCVDDSFDAERGWELQQMRGELAQRLGYTSIEMRDEHGTTWLCLPGCTIRPASEDEV